MRASTWLALNHGATGIVYYAMKEILAPGMPKYEWDLRKTPLWDEIRRETAKIRKYQDILLSGAGPIAMATRGPIDAAAWQLEGRTLIAVVNLVDVPVEGYVNLGPLAGGAAPRASWKRVSIPPFGVVIESGRD